MDTKLCVNCKKELSLDCFSKKKSRKDGLQSTCKECHKLYRKKHYENNKYKYVKKAKYWREQEKIKFYSWLKTQKCADCGIQDIRVLEFDHSKGIKNFEISKKIGILTFDVLMEEIKHCDIVCANCHRIRTAKQFNWFQYVGVV